MPSNDNLSVSNNQNSNPDPVQKMVKQNKAFKSLGTVRDYFAVQLEQDEQLYRNYR